MKYFWLVPKDVRWNNWILYRDSENGVSLRERYEDLRCEVCGKLDERQAIARGIDRDVKLRTRYDIITSDDGFLCYRKDLWHRLEERGVHGLLPIELPGEPEHLLMMPDPKAEVTVDGENSGVEFLGKCPRCGRYSETVCLPIKDSIDLQEDPLQLSKPSTPQENVRGALFFWLIAAKPLTDLMKELRVKGIEYLEVE